MPTIYQNHYGDNTGQFNSQAGANLDMTKFASPFWIESQHTRWDNGLPRKMNGEELLTNGTNSITRSIYVGTLLDKKRMILFKDNQIIQQDLDLNNNVIATANRTPAGWSPPSVNFNFSVAEFPLTITTEQGLISQVYIFFVALDNAEDPYTSKEEQIYFGRLDENLAFNPYSAQSSITDPFVPQKTSGGIIVTGQRLFIYGNNGIVRYTERNEFLLLPLLNYAAEGSLKYLAARLFRGGILFWSPNTLYFGTFTPNGLIIQIASAGISIISASSIIDGRNSTFYWMGIKQFFMYNGAIQPFANDMNRNYLFERINPTYHGNIWGVYIEDFTEFWWFVPTENSECDLLTIHNTKENTWYNTKMTRSAGISAGIVTYPLLADNQPLIGETNTTYPIWLQEKGINRKIGDTEYPIEAYVKSRMISIFGQNPQLNIAFRMRRFEKNINQSGEMILEIDKYNFPDSIPEPHPPIVFQEDTTNININVESSLLTLKFISNTLGGFFQFGLMLIDYEAGNPRPTE